MTERVYYRNAYAAEFDATVVSTTEEGGRTGVALDRTAFYPTSGGQPFDTGTIGDAAVVEVIDREDGTILHIVDGQAPSGAVKGRIDWARRFDHMQQHTGQHVLSAAFARPGGLETVSVHMGAVSSTIDLSREASAAEIAGAEEAANRIVWEDRPVTVRFVDATEAASLPLRKEPARSGLLRLVEVADVDVSACGGTHVARTGEIGAILVGGVERVRGGSRVEFRCGGRALAVHRELRDAVAGCVQLVSGTAPDLPRSVERLQAESRELRRRVRDLESRLAVHQAGVLVANALSIGDWRVVLAASEPTDAGGLKALAQAITARDHHAAVLCTAVPPVSVVVASSDGRALDASAVLKALIARFGGKGGGRPELAQGGALDATHDAVRAAALMLVHELVSARG
jgi:alanyl-tRNA synthetase